MEVDVRAAPCLVSDFARWDSLVKFDKSRKMKRVFEAALVGYLPDAKTCLCEHGDSPFRAQLPEITAGGMGEFAVEMVSQRAMAEPCRAAGTRQAVLFCKVRFHVGERPAKRFVGSGIRVFQFRQAEIFPKEEKDQLVGDPVRFRISVRRDLEESGEEPGKEFRTRNAEWCPG